MKPGLHVYAIVPWKGGLPPFFEWSNHRNMPRPVAPHDNPILFLTGKKNQ